MDGKHYESNAFFSAFTSAAWGLSAAHELFAHAYRVQKAHNHLLKGVWFRSCVASLPTARIGKHTELALQKSMQAKKEEPAMSHHAI
eukprot:1158762-Pelagomonas_calceolata.AAC.7